MKSQSVEINSSGLQRNLSIGKTKMFLSRIVLKLLCQLQANLAALPLAVTLFVFTQSFNLECS